MIFFIHTCYAAVLLRIAVYPRAYLLPLIFNYTLSIMLRK
jgi:hypothetical protein